MGKQTGCGLVRHGKTKYQTPKVEPTEKKKKPTGRAAKRERLDHHTTTQDRKTTFNAQGVNKFGMFPTDTRPSKVDPNSDLWDPSLHSTRKSTTSLPDPPHYGRSHHQETGKQWSRQYKKERIEKEGIQNPEESEESGSCSSEESQHEESYDSEESPDFKPQKTIKQIRPISLKSPKTLDDLDFIVFSAKPVDNTCVPSTGEIDFILKDDFLEEYEMKEILENAQAGVWTNDNENKRVQIFGYNYLDPEITPIPIPSCYKSLLNKIHEAGYGTYDQLIISEFSSGIGLSAHVDRFFWGEKIIGISFLSSCIMELESVQNENEKFSFILNPGSLYQLQGQSRYDYSHCIPPSSVLLRRISFTFRTLSNSKVEISNEAAKNIDFS